MEAATARRMRSSARIELAEHHPPHEVISAMANTARVVAESTNNRSISRRKMADGPTAEVANDAAFTERRQGPRRKVERRRQIDPTTCERDYTDEEIDFMRAMDDYKRKSGRQFPTWSEVIEVLRSLGYRKVAEPNEVVIKQQ